MTTRWKVPNSSSGSAPSVNMFLLYGVVVQKSLTCCSAELTLAAVLQRPYMVLGSLRDQLLYPTWAGSSAACGPGSGESDSAPSSSSNGARDVAAAVSSSVAEGSDNGSLPNTATLPPPSDAELETVLKTVRLFMCCGINKECCNM